MCNIVCTVVVYYICTHFQIGWRAFRSDFATSQPVYKTIANVVYPSFIFIMLCITSVSQVVSCLSRTRVSSLEKFWLVV